MRTILFYIILFFIMTTTSFASKLGCQVGSLVPASDSLAPIFSKTGNIYYSNNGHTIQITRTGKDFSPVLSPNKKMIAFVRKSNHVIPDSCDNDAKYGNEIWLYDLSIKKERLLVKK